MSKKILITGITSGIGLETARKLVGKNTEITGLVRNTQKAMELKKSGELPEEIGIVECDLADLKNVRECADRINSTFDRIDVLINNAGGIFKSRDESADGLEMTFAVNHLGHFALTTAILDKLTAGNARIINVSSEAHKSGKLNFDDLQAEKKYSAIKAYGDGKLCNIYFSRELARRYGEQGIASFALHPGVVRTNFFSPFGGVIGFLINTFSFLMISPEKGALTTVYLATEEGIEEMSGGYFKKSKPAAISGIAKDDEAARKLWEKSEEILSEKGF